MQNCGNDNTQHHNAMTETSAAQQKKVACISKSHPELWPLWRQNKRTWQEGPPRYHRTRHLLQYKWSCEFFFIILFMTSALKNDVNTTELSIFLWTSIRNLVYSPRDGDIKADWQTERNIIPKSISFLVYSEDSPQVWNSTL